VVENDFGDVIIIEEVDNLNQSHYKFKFKKIIWQKNRKEKSVKIRINPCKSVVKQTIHATNTVVDSSYPSR
jgi:hypothetical protein